MPGLLGACTIILGAGALGFYAMTGGRYWAIILTTTVIAVFVILFQSLVVSLFVAMDVQRVAGSVVAAIVVVITGYLMRLILQQTAPASLDRVLTGICIAFVTVGVLSILGIQPLKSDYSKPIFPFTEPSHFALSFSPFLIYQCVRSSLPVRLAWLAIALLLALLLQSLSLVVAVGLAAACCLSFSLLAGALVGLSAVIGYLDISYFTDRLDFSVNTTNVSTLVYIQGLELVEAGLRKTAGLGIGFQQLGVVPLNVPTSDLIYSINGDDANLRDGGFTAAKLIAELGFVGIGLIAVYLYALVKAVLALRALSSGLPGSAQERFALSVIAGLSIELFVRGGGYFTGTMVLMVPASLMALEHGYLRIRRAAVRRLLP